MVEVWPDPSKPLTPGQAIYLGGIIVYEVLGGGRYKVCNLYCPSRDAYCERRCYPLEHLPELYRYFEIEKKGVPYSIIREVSKGYVFVPVNEYYTDFFLFNHDIKGFIFVKKVPEDLYKEVLSMGYACDEELASCSYVYVLRKHGLEELADIEEKLASELRGVLLGVKERIKRFLEQEIKEVVEERLRSIESEIEKLREVIAEVIKEEKERKEVPTAKIIGEVAGIKDVLDVEYVRGKLLVFTPAKKLEDVAKKLKDMGLNVVETRVLGLTGVIKVKL